ASLVLIGQAVSVDQTRARLLDEVIHPGKAPLRVWAPLNNRFLRSLSQRHPSLQPAMRVDHAGHVERQAEHAIKRLGQYSLQEFSLAVGRLGLLQLGRILRGKAESNVSAQRVERTGIPDGRFDVLLLEHSILYLS